MSFFEKGRRLFRRLFRLKRRKRWFDVDMRAFVRKENACYLSRTEVQS